MNKTKWNVQYSTKLKKFYIAQWYVAKDNIGYWRYLAPNRYTQTIPYYYETNEEAKTILELV